MAITMRWPTILATALAFLLLACGGNGGAEADIGRTVEDFFRSLGENQREAYNLLAKECRSKISFSDFNAGTAELETFLVRNEIKVRNVDIIERSDDEVLANLDIVLVSGDESAPFAQDSLGQGRFVQERERWRFAECENFRPEEELSPREAALAAAAAVEADDDPTLPGVFVDLQAIYGGVYGSPEGPTTAPHVRWNVDYLAEQGQLPPAGGPHWGSGPCPADPVNAPPFCGSVPWGIYREAWQAGNLVHNMEHSGVVLWYNTTDQAIIDELEDLVEERLNAGQLLVMTPYPEMEAEQIAITSWSHIDKFPVGEYSKNRVEEFIDVHERRFNPEDF